MTKQVVCKYGKDEFSLAELCAILVVEGVHAVLDSQADATLMFGWRSIMVQVSDGIESIPYYAHNSAGNLVHWSLNRAPEVVAKLAAKYPDSKVIVSYGGDYSGDITVQNEQLYSEVQEVLRKSLETSPSTSVWAKALWSVKLPERKTWLNGGNSAAIFTPSQSFVTWFPVPFSCHEAGVYDYTPFGGEHSYRLFVAPLYENNGYSHKVIQSELIGDGQTQQNWDKDYLLSLM